MSNRHRQFLGAVAPWEGNPYNGGVRLIYSDAEHVDREPFADIAKTLKDNGFDSTGLDMLVTTTHVAKARRRSENFLSVIKAAMLTAGHGPDVLPWAGIEYAGVLKAVRHDGRQHPETGRFTSMTEPRSTKVAGLTWVHGDTRRNIPWALDGGKRHPSGDGDPDAGQAAYSGGDNPSAGH